MKTNECLSYNVNFYQAILPDHFIIIRMSFVNHFKTINSQSNSFFNFGDHSGHSNIILRDIHPWAIIPTSFQWIYTPDFRSICCNLGAIMQARLNARTSTSDKHSTIHQLKVEDLTCSCQGSWTFFFLQRLVAIWKAAKLPAYCTSELNMVGCKMVHLPEYHMLLLESRLKL